MVEQRKGAWGRADASHTAAKVAGNFIWLPDAGLPQFLYVHGGLSRRAASLFSSSGRVMLRAPLTETLTTHSEAHKLSICQLSLLVIRRRFCLSGAMTPLLRFCAW